LESQEAIAKYWGEGLVPPLIWDRVGKVNFLTDNEKRAAVGYAPLGEAVKKSRRTKRAKHKIARLHKDIEIDDGGDDEGDDNSKPQAGGDAYDPYDPSSPYFDPDPTGYGDPYDVWRPVTTQELGGGLFKILPSCVANSRNEKWQFPPETIVRAEEKILYEGMKPVSVLVAVKAQIN